MTRRYDRREIAAAIAGLPYTAACSPKTMAFPGADTMNVGAIGDESFLSILNCGIGGIFASWGLMDVVGVAGRCVSGIH